MLQCERVLFHPKEEVDMIKTILYIPLLLTTAIRFISVVILLTRESTSLPTIVILATSLTIVYGVLLLVRRFIFTIHIKNFIQFFAAQSLVFGFNLLFVSNTVALQVNLVERLVVGSLLDILINCVAIYYCIKNMRRKKFVTVGNVR